MVHHRQRRVGDQIRSELALLVLQDVKDPRVGFVTITEVRMSSDLKSARVYVSVLGDDSEEEASLQALHNAAGFLRGAIGRRLSLRYVPQLCFAADRTLKTGYRIERLLRGQDVDDGGDDEESK